MLVLKKAVAGAFLVLVSSANAYTFTASFDTFAEGVYGTSLEDGGLVFRDLDTRSPQSPGDFSVEDAAGSLEFPLSPPNVLSAGSFVPGRQATYGRFGSMTIDFGPFTALAAGVDVFAVTTGDNAIALEAIRAGTVVARDTWSMRERGLWRRLLVGGTPFDHLRLVASGPDDSGVVFANFDNVTVIVVPEPAIVALLGVGLLGLFGYRWGFQRRQGVSANRRVQAERCGGAPGARRWASHSC